MDVARTVEAVWRLESARIIAGLTRLVHDVGLANDLAQDALVAALSQWPAEGVPDNPGACVTSVAKRRAIHHLRGAQRLAAHRSLEHARPGDRAAGTAAGPVVVARMVVLSAHPVL